MVCRCNTRGQSTSSGPDSVCGLAGVGLVAVCGVVVWVVVLWFTVVPLPSPTALASCWWAKPVPHQGCGGRVPWFGLVFEGWMGMAPFPHSPGKLLVGKASASPGLWGKGAMVWCLRVWCLRVWWFVGFGLVFEGVVLWEGGSLLASAPNYCREEYTLRICIFLTIKKQ